MPIFNSQIQALITPGCSRIEVSLKTIADPDYSEYPALTCPLELSLLWSFQVHLGSMSPWEPSQTLSILSSFCTNSFSRVLPSHDYSRSHLRMRSRLDCSKSLLGRCLPKNPRLTCLFRVHIGSTFSWEPSETISILISSCANSISTAFPGPDYSKCRLRIWLFQVPPGSRSLRWLSVPWLFQGHLGSISSWEPSQTLSILSSFCTDSSWRAFSGPDYSKDRLSIRLFQVPSGSMSFQELSISWLFQGHFRWTYSWEPSRTLNVLSYPCSNFFSRALPSHDCPKCHRRI